MPETMGSGVGWIDYDADGWPDLFCVQDGPLPPARDPALTHRLYRNNRDGTFLDVTAATGLDRSGFGMGCAVGDYDNDGFDDLVVTELGGIVLFHNEPGESAPGGRRFVDATARAGLANTRWGTSCAWGDLDGNAFLDLYLCNYVQVDPNHPITCRNEEKQLYYQCSPTAFPRTHHLLFQNNGNGKFTDVSEASGIARVETAPGLGVVIVDLDADGKQDIYVANDLAPAYLFRNLGGMRFEETALPVGCGLGPGGSRMAGMGVVAGDFDGSARPSLFLTNFQSSPNVLFLNRGGLRFDDASYSSGLGGPSTSRLGFGTCALDANLDGHVDLAVANGHVQRVAAELGGGSYAQDAQLFLGDGNGKFRDVSAGAGPDFLKPRIGRGLAHADFDRDGLPDLVLSGVGEPLALLRNRAETRHGWIALELVGDGTTSNRNAVGSVLTIEVDGKKQTHFVIGGGSYLSASERSLAVGLGMAEAVGRVEVKWPSGRIQEFRGLAARCRWRLQEGTSTPLRVSGPTPP
jgi:hypothetical protein